MAQSIPPTLPHTHIHIVDCPTHGVWSVLSLVLGCILMWKKRLFVYIMFFFYQKNLWKVLKKIRCSHLIILKLIGYKIFRNIITMSWHEFFYTIHSRGCPPLSRNVLVWGQYSIWGISRHRELVNIQCEEHPGTVGRSIFWVRNIQAQRVGQYSMWGYPGTMSWSIFRVRNIQAQWVGQYSMWGISRHHELVNIQWGTSRHSGYVNIPCEEHPGTVGRSIFHVGDNQLCPVGIIVDTTWPNQIQYGIHNPSLKSYFLKICDIETCIIPI